MNWDALDFVVAGILIGGVGLGIWIATRLSDNKAYRAGAALALIGGLLLIWMNLAVGIIGSENEPFNLFYGGVIGIGVLGALVTKFKPDGLSKVLLAMTGAQVLIGLMALGLGKGGPAEIVLITGFFCLFWFASAALFRRASGPAATT